MANDLDVFRRTLTKNGWLWEKGKSGHWKGSNPTTDRIMVIPSTSSDFRAVKNAVRDLKSLGFEADGKPVTPASKSLDAAAKEAARLLNEQREERSMQERIAQSLSSESPEPAQSTETPVADILDHPMLQFVVEDPPPPRPRRGGRPSRAKKPEPEQLHGYDITMPELPKPGSKPQPLEIPVADDFSADLLLAGAVISPPVSALDQVWIEVFEKMPVNQWLKMPGTYPQAKVRAARKAAELTGSHCTVSTKGSITTDEVNFWLKKEEI